MAKKLKRSGFRVRVPSSVNQKGGPISSSKDKKRKRDRRSTKTELNKRIYDADGL